MSPMVRRKICVIKKGETRCDYSDMLGWGKGRNKVIRSVWGRTI